MWKDALAAVLFGLAGIGGKTPLPPPSPPMVAPNSPSSSDESSSFLFATFRGEGSPLEEQVYLALSEDGRRWTPLNGGQPVLINPLGERGARDPFLLRARDGSGFFLLATDLSINRVPDWSRAVRAGSRSILVWHSPDLVTWSGPHLAPVAPEDAGCAWAPEAIYDEEHGDYLVFWASTTARDAFAKHRIWAARTRDFQTFGEAFVFIERAASVIDTTIVREGPAYHRFTKDEQRKTITQESAPHLSGPWDEVAAFSLAHLEGFEGPQCYPLACGGDGEAGAWSLILDHYATGAGYQPFVTHDLASGRFEPARDFVFPYRFRHGSVLRISGEEHRRLAP
jgi:hypothetical protein